MKFNQSLINKIQQNDSSITTIDLSEPLSAENTLELANALKGNTMIKVLSLTNCRLNEYSITHLANVLLENKTIQQLNLSENLINNNGVAILAKALADNFAICSINLFANPVGNKGVLLLIELLQKNHLIRDLKISDEYGFYWEGLFKEIKCNGMPYPGEEHEIIDRSSLVEINQLLRHNRQSSETLFNTVNEEQQKQFGL